MPQDVESSPKKTDIPAKPAPSSWFRTPKPVKRLFDKFPLVTYPANELPQRKSLDRRQNALYIFAREGDVRRDAPSFNPSCLKWQTYLKLIGVDFVTVPSSNHASPNGALPFLIPAYSNTQSTLDTVAPIASNKLQEWASKNGRSVKEESENMRYEAYMSLLDHRIRNAWLHTLYLNPVNFVAVTQPLYIEPSTTSTPARYALSKTLQGAALAEALKTSTSPVADISVLYRESDNAFSALSELLGDHEWFFDEDSPSLFDAAVFAYTHLLLDDRMAWRKEEERLGKGLRERRWKNLVDHERRIYQRCYQ
ncbi:MAG: hypothetical protein Q9218_003047 [Villophora microphyllina]